MIKYLLVLMICLCFSVGAFAQDEVVFSGPQPGERLAPFKIELAYGTKKGETADVVLGDGPTLLVFVQGANRPASPWSSAIEVCSPTTWSRASSGPRPWS